MVLVLACAWDRGDVDFAVLDDAVGVRGRVAHADGRYCGVWRKAENTLLVCGRETDWVPRDIEPVPGTGTRSRSVRQVFATPHGVARLAPGELPDSYAVHVEWGPRSRPVAVIPGPDAAPWDDAIRWAGRWAHTALVRHADRPAERLALRRPDPDGQPPA